MPFGQAGHPIRLVSGQSVTANQMEFIHQIVDEVTQTGIMPVSRLCESPFVDLNPMGPEGVFPAHRLDEIEQVLREIEARAA